MAIFKLEDLTQSLGEMVAKDWQRRIDAMNAYLARFPPPPLPPWHVRAYRSARYYVTRFRIRLGEIIAGRRFGDW